MGLGGFHPPGLVGVMGSAAAASSPEPLDLESVKRRHVRRVIGMTGGNKSAAAKLLGVHRRTLSRGGY